ncbi:MAG TPA: FAD binding domain-containing protein [Thermoplasmata archaeon]|nr:FAD binding domain-containing protein [Thermoplasmata archaeon]
MPFTIRVPASVEEALELLGESGGDGRTVLAGGTDLLLDIEDGHATAKELVSLRRLPWNTVRWNRGGVVIGSTVSLAKLDAEPRIRSELTGLWEGTHAVGGVALRHRATLGGNLGRAGPSSDIIPILLALDARVRLVRQGGERELPVESFILASRKTALHPAELISAIVIPSVAPSAYLWERVRPANDISQVGVAVALLPTSPHWRIAVGGVLPRAQRLLPAEAVLPSPDPSEFELELAAQSAAEHAPFATDRRASDAYRRRLVTVLVRRALRLVLDRHRDFGRPGAR